MLRIPTGLSQKLDDAVDSGWKRGSLVLLELASGARSSLAFRLAETYAKGYQVGLLSDNPRASYRIFPKNINVYTSLDSIPRSSNDIVLLDLPGSVDKVPWIKRERLSPSTTVIATKQLGPFGELGSWQLCDAADYIVCWLGENGFELIKPEQPPEGPRSYIIVQYRIGYYKTELYQQGEVEIYDDKLFENWEDAKRWGERWRLGADELENSILNRFKGIG